MKRVIVLATGHAGGVRRHGGARDGGRRRVGTDVCSGWEAAGAAGFDSLGSLARRGSSARAAGHVPKEPSLTATYEPMPASAKGKGGQKFRASVPVWIHVISDGVTATSRRSSSTRR